MEMKQIIEQAERNICQALRDYGAHTCQTAVLDDVSDIFIRTLARDSSYAKQGLRDLFSKSPVWDERIDALVINGTRTHNPDYDRIRSLGEKILHSKIGWLSDTDGETRDKIKRAIQFFASPDTDTRNKEIGIRAIQELAPKAYAPMKKSSRIFKAFCVALGVADETAGSEFQRLYAQFADELNAKKISFKLYVSINPAHFITMSNPKGDDRGCTLTSCHSFNNTEYEYNVGCTGYARDSVSFIVFTVDDPGNPELLNNRKTTRQIFAYRPGNGLLMQSRMYDTAGGTHGAQKASELYRDLIQREISMLEGAPNLWKTYPYCDGHESCIDTHPDFGGYADWTYADFDGKVSIRVDHLEDYYFLEVGAAGLCIRCGTEISQGLYCADCKSEHEDEDEHCGRCGERCNEVYPVYNEHGERLYVCSECRDDHYTECDECGEYYPDDCMTTTDNGSHVCGGCLDAYYTCCDECGEYFPNGDTHEVTDKYGDTVRVCQDCRSAHYTKCNDCKGYFHDDIVYTVYDKNGYQILVCGNCLEDYQECPSCGEHIIDLKEGGVCPMCGAVIEEEKGVSA